MQVFVVVKELLDQPEYIKAFLTKEAANIFVKEPSRVDYQIWEKSVKGNIDDPNTVYITQRYGVGDFHYFKDVYGNYSQAKTASGEKGQALACKIG
ncbi:hypothetical protein [Desulforegula conservatrix]|uniref:hypothetical protein n=1 Tax=Desulforegula conservatrix TaxID=153026 RepID=UPI0004056650|nr:hypothetical protein [Desulforegula conservatrix]